MIIFREKEFSTDTSVARNYVINGTQEMLIEAIKYIDFHEQSKSSNGDDTQHWINQLSTRILQLDINFRPYFYMFLGVWPNEIVKKALKGNSYEFLQKFPKSILRQPKRVQ